MKRLMYNYITHIVRLILDERDRSENVRSAYLSVASTAQRESPAFIYRN